MLRLARVFDSGTWWLRNVPDTCCPSTCSGPVQPFGVRSTTTGHFTAPVSPPLRAVDRARSIASRLRSKAAARSWCTEVGSSPVTNTGSQP